MGDSKTGSYSVRRGYPKKVYVCKQKSGPLILAPAPCRLSRGRLALALGVPGGAT